MKNILFPLVLATLPLGCAVSSNTSNNSPETNQGTLTYQAMTDFSVLNAGNAPYYLDDYTNSLGIDARHIEFRNVFAKATTKFEGPSGYYDVTITNVTEEDGEPIYRLHVNDDIVGTYQGSYIGKGSDRDLKPETHTWRNIKLNQGDVIGIASNTDTNGEVPEHGGTAWARGRWQKLEFTKSGELENKRAFFNKNSDILISQFDFQPDADDIHAVAALGSMLIHPDLKGVNYFAVAGTVGIQGGKYHDARSLMALAFGRENLTWADAKQNWQGAVEQVTNKVRAVLAQGGKVWVQEAGQSDFTADWLKALAAAGVHESVIKNNVIVVQHSKWNEDKATPEKLAYVKDKAFYQAITDGNKPKKVFIRNDRRGPLTPMYVEEGSKWIEAATSEKNSFEQARKLWQEADKIVKASGFNSPYSVMPKGGVDFSDVVEAWWIFNIGQPANSVHAFWERYVTDIELDKINPPKGRLAIVSDGNSPDPDDIGAKPVMFAMLDQTDLTDRVVHVSHSCDLDPTRNKGYQIDAESELRRQKILHHLTGKSFELFGPFKNVREYYNCRVKQEEAINDLVDAINASTENDPLWIIEAGEPDLIGFALQKANKEVIPFIHVVSHHPANDDSGDYFTWQQILDFGVIEHQIGDQNVGLQTPIAPWDWTKNHESEDIRFIREMFEYAEKDGVVPFQTGKFDCSDAGMLYWWITGANNGGNNFAGRNDIKDMLLLKSKK